MYSFAEPHLRSEWNVNHHMQTSNTREITLRQQWSSRHSIFRPAAITLTIATSTVNFHTFVVQCFMCQASRSPCPCIREAGVCWRQWGTAGECRSREHHPRGSPCRRHSDVPYSGGKRCSCATATSSWTCRSHTAPAGCLATREQCIDNVTFWRIYVSFTCISYRVFIVTQYTNLLPQHRWRLLT